VTIGWVIELRNLGGTQVEVIPHITRDPSARSTPPS
jgi:hypothetical protein